MSLIQSVTAPEQWLIEVNGGYDVCFQMVTVSALAAPVVTGQVIAVAGVAGVSFGIVDKAYPVGTTKLRVMVRGNPSIVNAKALNFKALNLATTTTALANQGIIVVNN